MCEDHDVDYEECRNWYDGYKLNGYEIYNPESVVKCVRERYFDSYWGKTSTYKVISERLEQNFYGTKDEVIKMLAGENVDVNVTSYLNTMDSFASRNDVFTYLIHLGYLAYNAENKTVRIPNEEIRRDFQRSVREVRHTETLKRLQASDQLFLDTLQGNADAVAAQIEKVHTEETSPLHYNREDSLRSVIKLAYYTYRDHYLQWEELPAGNGYADIVYLPKRDSDWPALLIELKWNQSAEGAIAQIHNRQYPEVLKGLGKEILLVGINYDKNAPAGQRRHSCRIEKWSI